MDQPVFSPVPAPAETVGASQITTGTSAKPLKSGSDNQPDKKMVTGFSVAGRMSVMDVTAVQQQKTPSARRKAQFFPVLLTEPR